jgi:hypothetical protein
MGSIYISSSSPFTEILQHNEDYLLAQLIDDQCLTPTLAVFQLYRDVTL